jgi:5'-deoxynucleotidase YfbR-like HD superfamily hydrolase
MKDSQKAWISTYTGKKFFLLHPRLKDIDIRDIAHALSQQCRWTGHTKHHYSIAQHSYYCSFLVPEGDALDALMHDASEAFMGDMNRPLKHFTSAGPAYRAQEAVVQNAIAVRFGMRLVEPESVHIADNLMLYAEKKQLIRSKFREAQRWGRGAANVKITRWTPEKAERMFLKRFRELIKRK